MIKVSDEPFIFLFDNTDKLLQDGEFPNFLEFILKACHNIKIIFTCRDPVLSYSSIETGLNIEGLIHPKQDSWELFVVSCNRVIT